MILNLGRRRSIAHWMRVLHRLLRDYGALHHCLVKVRALNMLVLLLMNLIFFARYLRRTCVHNTFSSLLFTLRHECRCLRLILLVLLYGLFRIVDARLVSSLQEILLASLWLLEEIL